MTIIGFLCDIQLAYCCFTLEYCFSQKKLQISSTDFTQKTKPLDRMNPKSVQLHSLPYMTAKYHFDCSDISMRYVKHKA